MSNATGVNIWDILPVGVDYVSGGDQYDSVARKVSWTIALVEAGKSVDVKFVVNVTKAGNLNNTAFANSTDNDTVVNDTTDNITVVPNVELEVVKQVVAVGDIDVGDNFAFVVTVTNHGLSNATNVIVSDVLDDAFGYVSSNGDWDTNTHSIVWTIDQIDAGDSTQVYVIVRALNNGTFNNTAVAYSEENQTTTENTVNVTIIPLVDVAIDLEVNNETPDMGAEVIITVTVRNNGPSTATNITGKLGRDFLNGLKIISIDSDDIIFHDGLLGYILSEVLSINEDGTFEIDHLDPDQEVTATIVAQIIRDGDIFVDGNVSSKEKDSNLTNNVDLIAMYVHSIVELDVNKTVDNTNPTVGDTIEYTITVVNAGPSNATGINVSEKLPDGLVYISDSGDGAYDPDTGIWKIDSMKTNETKSLTIKVLVNATGEITNCINASSNEDNINTNNSKTNVTINVKPKTVDIVSLVIANTTKATVGDLVEFAIGVENYGVTNATGVKVAAKLPDGFKFVSDDGLGTYDPNSGIWTIGDLPAGEYVILHIVAQATKVGNLTFTVVATANEEISNATLAMDNETVEVVGVEPEPADNKTDADTEVTLLPTGNPLLVLIMALLFAGVTLRRKKE